MTTGEKIKLARQRLNMTQAELAGDTITRNMLSAIESGKATPSVATLQYLAATLGVPAPYLLSDENDLFFFIKKERMPAIKSALETHNYNACISLILKMDTLDDELYYILAMCYFEIGVASFKNGSMLSSKKQLTLSQEYCKRTMYDTSSYLARIPLYLAIANNVNFPLLEFDEDGYAKMISDVYDYEFYKYVTLDFDFKYTDFRYKTHIAAKQLIKERRYGDAVKLLLEIDEKKTDLPRNAYLMFSVYGDLETCYRQLVDFENAYKYSSKRLSLMEGFNF